MGPPLSDTQRRDIQAVLDTLDLGPCELLVAIDTATGERLSRRGRVESAHRACAEADPRHRPRKARWACERHGLFGQVLVAADRVGVLSVRANAHSEPALEALRAAVRAIARILRGRGSASTAEDGPVRPRGPRAAAMVPAREE